MRPANFLTLLTLSFLPAPTYQQATAVGVEVDYVLELVEEELEERPLHLLPPHLNLPDRVLDLCSSPPTTPLSILTLSLRGGKDRTIVHGSRHPQDWPSDVDARLISLYDTDSPDDVYARIARMGMGDKEIHIADQRILDHINNLPVDYCLTPRYKNVLRNYASLYVKYSEDLRNLRPSF